MQVITKFNTNSISCDIIVSDCRSIFDAITLSIRLQRYPIDDLAILALPPRRYIDRTAVRLSGSFRPSTLRHPKQNRPNCRFFQCFKGCSDRKVIDDFITRQQLCRMTGITDNANLTCIINFWGDAILLSHADTSVRTLAEGNQLL
ncbi:hypothetical protein CEXT_635701 [Caerostris extrusa]|uniref:Uncharacterized protein n=1 Tax=Caerostris extrusa TaxID=172846 RepID=A0AAV4RMX1_CAEEX|nr:hypothetical protein CEXT_635701 [Caerostris extrusa]